MSSSSLKYVVAALAATLALPVGAIDQAQLRREQKIERASPDVPRTALQRRLSHATPGRASPTLAGPTDDQVGDSDSFGRNVTWLGLTSAFINLDTSCPPSDPDTRCQVLGPVASTTVFQFLDAARIQLPPKATHSLLCYWFSPVLSIGYQNPTAGTVNGRLSYSPTLTIENPVLNDPALIDPTTGVAFDGSLLTSMTSSEQRQEQLAPGTQLFERSRDSAVCMAGLLSRKTLMETYGLTGAQADQFFKKPTMVRLNVSGSSQYVSFAEMVFGLRVVGD